MPTIGKYGKIIFLPEEIEFIAANYEQMTNKQLADHFGFKIQKVRPMLYELGFKRMELEYWTEEQIQFLKDNYQIKGDLELSVNFEEAWPKNKKWTLKHIEKKRNYLKLHRTKDELIKIKERNVLAGSYLTGKTWRTRVASKVGTIKIWKTTAGFYYPVIKTEKGFVHYYRWLWVKHHGKIGADDLVVPKKEKSRNEILHLEDLEIVDRAEHARRNSEIIKSRPREIREIVRLINKIRKKVKNPD